MPKLKAEPAGRIRSLREFFALAGAMEIDAVTRYTETAVLLRQRGQPELAKIFDHLAETERGHVAQVASWAESLQEVPSLDQPLPWPVPDTFDMPPEEAASSKLMTPYKALASAVRHEQRSFAFWTYVSAHANEPEVKKAAERMALEELEHVSLLRSERRRAYRAERKKIPADRAIALSMLATLERRLAALIDRDRRTADESTTLSLVVSGRDAASKLEALDTAHLAPLKATAIPSGREENIEALAEYLADAYLQLVDTAPNGEMLTSFQELAKLAVYRLGILRLPQG
jgi:rubrerythrin